MYDEKTQHYFMNVRKDILDLIPEEKRAGNLLEIGAGTGDSIIFAKNNGYAIKVWGIELCKIENSHQDNNEIEQFIISNIENLEIPFEKSSFDVIILGDVLEHLVDPYKLIVRLQEFIKSDGVIIASIPNIRGWNTMKTIFFNGDFKYEDTGILDKTHLRFFTKKNMLELFTKNGYSVEKIVPKDYFNLTRYKKQFRIFKLIGIFYFEEFVTHQYFIVAKLNIKV